MILAFSRILLAVPESLAPWVALLFATNILVGCALAASIRGTRGFAFLIALLVGTILGGGIAAAVVGERPVHSLVEEETGPPGPSPTAAPPAEESPAPGEESPAPAEEPPAGSPDSEVARIAAEGVAFDVDELSLPAEGEAIIAFDNRDSGIPHNVSIYGEGGDPVFQGEIITGPAMIEYRFPTPAPGSYEFRCDVHPQMNGSATVG
jgi:plastocyanin